WISTHFDSTHFQNYASQVGDQVISSSLISDPPVLAPISGWGSSYFFYPTFRSTCSSPHLRLGLCVGEN
ncbi:hypothetical protein CMV_027448, partial [Castanea mollissima]